MALSTAESYRAAAREHLERADRLHASEEFFLAHYMSGLAVECHLRAHLRLLTSEFDARHDLEKLAEEAGFTSIVPQNLEAAFSIKFETLNRRWRSNQRYYTERQFLDYMTTIRAEFHQGGNRWKNLSRTILNLAHEIINQGEAKWSSR